MELINLVVALAVIGLATYFISGRAPAWAPRGVAVLLAAQAAVSWSWAATGGRR